MRAVPDDVLRRALEHDDDEAFAAVCRMVRPGLAATCAAIVGHEAAEDVVQEVLLKIWTGRRRFDPARSSFATWASAIARNTAIDHARAAATRATTARELERARLAHEPCHEHRMIASDDRRAVRAAVARLPAAQRRAIFDAYWLERSHSEAAVGLGIPLGTLKGRVRSALSALRPGLDEPLLTTG